MPSQYLTALLCVSIALSGFSSQAINPHISEDESLLENHRPPLGLSKPRTGRRAIFCATSGRTGTHLLSELLDVFPDTLSLHEPEPRMVLNEYKGALPETREERERVKLSSILEEMEMEQSKHVYAEMSNMFIKTFWDLDWWSHFDSVHVVILRRWGPSVVKAHLNSGLGLEAFRHCTSWSNYTETKRLEDAAILWPEGAREHAVNRMIYYVLDIEQRTQRLKRQLGHKLHFVEVTYEDLIKADPAYLRMVFSQLGYDVKGPLLGELKARIGPKPPSVVRVERPWTDRECLNKMWDFLLTFEPEVDQQGLQALMRHRTAPLQMRVVVLAAAPAPSSAGLSEWLAEVLEYADGVVLAGHEPTANASSIARAWARRVAFISETGGSSADRQRWHGQGASHVLFVDTRQALSPNITPYVRVLLASLAPDKSVTLVQWHPANPEKDRGTGAVKWRAGRKARVGWRPAAGVSADEWLAEAAHALRRRALQGKSSDVCQQAASAPSWIDLDAAAEGLLTLDRAATEGG